MCVYHGEICITGRTTLTFVSVQPSGPRAERSWVVSPGASGGGRAANQACGPSEQVRTLLQPDAPAVRFLAGERAARVSHRQSCRAALL